MHVVIVKTGIANLASVIAACKRVGATTAITTSPKTVFEATHLILPGVGAFGAAIDQLTQHDLIAPLKDRFQAQRPTLAICLGLQLLCHLSEESPKTHGLGIIDATIKRFKGHRVPQLGWNKVIPDEKCNLLTEGYAYFANSYYLPAAPIGWATAETHFEVSFISALEKGAWLACQFHPELSGKWGETVIKRWLTAYPRT